MARVLKVVPHTRDPSHRAGSSNYAASANLKLRYTADILSRQVMTSHESENERLGWLVCRVPCRVPCRVVTTCHDLPPALRRQRKRCRLQDVATSGICLTVGPGHRAIPRWKEGNVLLPTLHRCIYGFNCETDARRSSVCSRQRLRCIKGPQGKRSTTLLQLAFASQMGLDIEQYIVGKRETPSCL